MNANRMDKVTIAFISPFYLKSIVITYKRLLTHKIILIPSTRE